jgi:hypothetical protein
MPKPAIACLREKLSASRCYLEYGAGGSTLMAASLRVPAIISVESDAAWCRAVSAEIQPLLQGSTFHMHHADIGETRAWGEPAGNDNAHLWLRYPVEVWDMMNAAGLAPDLVLLDGRFRVACFMACLLRARPGTIILFDDFVGREEHYGRAAQYLTPSAFADRMAVFIVPKIIDRDAAEKDLVLFSAEYR